MKWTATCHTCKTSREFNPPAQSGASFPLPTCDRCHGPMMMHNFSGIVSVAAPLPLPTVTIGVMPSPRDLILREVAAERVRQHEKFGDQDDVLGALSDLMIGVGRACREWEREPELLADAVTSCRVVRAELVQVAAVAVQIIEHIDQEADRG